MAKKETFIFREDYPVVSTKQGKLRGFFYKDVFTFYGVRYARARRFEMPEEIPHWKGVQNATGYGYISPILGSPKPSGEHRIAHRFWPASEDCQYLNIWSKSIDKKAKKPVIVWFHGGGFADGSSIEQSCYDGANLARREDVVVVTVNHRLNAFGFLDLSKYGEKWKNSGNVGIADLVASLQWVHDNIAGFGGDPKNVTIIGQSGGGMKVTCMGQIPAAAGLFHKAMPMSGIMAPSEDGSPMPSEVTSADIAKEVFKTAKIKEGNVEALQKLTTKQYISVVNKAGMKFVKAGKSFSWGPVANDYYLGDPLVVGFGEYYKTVPTLATTVISEFGARGYKSPKDKVSAAEQKAMVAKVVGKKNADRVIAAFKEAYPDKQPMDLVAVDRMMRPATIMYAEKKAEVSSAPTYNYLFTLDFALENGVPAWHCSDIPFIFHTKEVQPCMDMGPEVDKLEDLMSKAVANFARTGDPNTRGLPKWKPVEPDKCWTMLFDKKPVLKADHDKELLKVLDETMPVPHLNISQFYDEDAENDHDWMY